MLSNAVIELTIFKMIFEPNNKLIGFLIVMNEFAKINTFLFIYSTDKHWTDKKENQISIYSFKWPAETSNLMSSNFDIFNLKFCLKQN